MWRWHYIVYDSSNSDSGIYTSAHEPHVLIVRLVYQLSWLKTEIALKSVQNFVVILVNYNSDDISIFLRFVKTKAAAN